MLEEGSTKALQRYTSVNVLTLETSPILAHLDRPFQRGHSVVRTFFGFREMRENSHLDAWVYGF